MTSWVVDCSLVLGRFLPDEKSDRADRFFASLRDDATLHVPPVFWYEAANALACAGRKKRVSLEQADRLASLMSNLPLTCEPATGQTMVRLSRVARQYGLSAYDAAYLDLALRTGSGLATLDDDLARAASSVGVEIAV